MKKTNVEGVVTEVVRPIAEHYGLELIDVEYVKEGGSWYLRIYIDKPGGVGMDDCQAVSEEVGRKLDELDPIPGNYFLEVSSPGLERSLKRERDFEYFAGREAAVHLFAPLDGKKEFTGVLKGMVDGNVMLLVDGREMSFPREKISRAHLVVRF